MKKVKILIIFALILILFGSSFTTYVAYSKHLDELDQVNALTSARGMCVLEGNTNKILYGINEHAKLPMASTTKILTAILAIEHFKDLSQSIKVNDLAVGIEGTSIYLQEGEILTVEELLYGLILASGNDAAKALALAICETEEEFAVKMTEFAKSIGAENSSFANSHGLDAKDHYTTAYDLALITSYGMKNEDFKRIVSTQFKQITGNPKSGERYLRNKNKLTFTQENNVGVKTGFTDNAGRCLVNAVEQDGMLIITTLLNCGPMFEEARSLTNLALRNYEIKEFVSPYNYVGTIPVENGDKQDVNIVSIKGFKIPVKKNEYDNYKVVYDMPETLTAPIKKTDVIGKVNVYYNDELVYSENLYSIEDVNNIDLQFMLSNIIKNWF